MSDAVLTVLLVIGFLDTPAADAWSQERRNIDRENARRDDSTMHENSMTPALLVVLIVGLPLVALQIIYLAGWRDHWFTDESDIEREKNAKVKRH